LRPVERRPSVPDDQITDEDIITRRVADTTAYAGDDTTDTADTGDDSGDTSDTSDTGDDSGDTSDTSDTGDDGAG
jgi:hypothetical protein